MASIKSRSLCSAIIAEVYTYWTILLRASTTKYNITMYNTTRTNLLNYLNNNKIEYTFDKASQTITVDLTVTKE